MRNKNCIVCGTPLTAALGQQWEMDPPAGAVIFTAKGNYGSTVWDQDWLTGGSHLKIAVCDSCLKKAAARDMVIEVKPCPTPMIETQWKADNDIGYGHEPELH